MTEHPTVERAAKRAADFAARARLEPTNLVIERVKEERLFGWTPRTRTYHVEVQDRTGRWTTCGWTVAIEDQEGRRRSVRFFGWGYSLHSPGKPITESMAYARVTN